MNFRSLFYLFYKTIRLRLIVLQLTDESMSNLKNLTKKNEHYIYNNVHFLKHNF